MDGIGKDDLASYLLCLYVVARFLGFIVYKQCFHNQ
jgi:hypothetical protein